MESARTTVEPRSPVRVLIVDQAIDFGGSIVSTANLIRGLDRRQFEPIFVSSTSEELVGSKLLEARRSTRVIIARRFFHYRRLAKIMAAIQRLPIGLLQKPLIYSLYVVRHIGNLPYTLRIVYWMLRLRVDLVQLNNGTGADEVDLACMALRKPRVMFFRGYEPLGRIQRKCLIPGVRGFVSVSNHIRDEAIADGIDATKIIAATPPAILEKVVPAALAEARKANGINTGDLVFGIFGRIVEWKGQREFLRAAAIVLQRLPQAKAFVVGDVSDGDVAYLEALHAYLRESGLADRVRFTGYRADVHTYYNLMDVVVHASVTPEPSGRVIFEAMSYGVPVVASCNGGPPEFIESGVDGYIVDPTDTQLLADRITELLADPELRRTMGARAEQKMATFYNKDVYARAVEQVYRKALSNGLHTTRSS